ncbi:MAG: phage holin family protein [Opitutaceae bacterium]|nr:phage holin family protein [Opitutaceae bacterium]
MEPGTPRSDGFLGSFRTLGDSLLASLQDRLALFSVELQEEKFRLIQIFIWISAAVFTGVMAITFASLTLVYLFWESARLAALGGLTLLYSGALIAIIVAFRRYLARQPKPFAATLQEITEDRSCIRKPS